MKTLIEDAFRLVGEGEDKSDFKVEFSKISALAHLLGHKLDDDELALFTKDCK